MGARNWVLLGVAASCIVGLTLALTIGGETWPRVYQFFSGYMLPLLGGVAALIAGNVAVDKITQNKGVPDSATKVDPGSVYKP